MQTQAMIEESHGLSPSFSCYSSDSLLTSKAVDKVIREEHAASPFHELEDDEFEFSFVFSDEEEADIHAWTTFPVFKRDVLSNDEINHKDGSAAITSSLRNMFSDDKEEWSSCSSSEVEELENIPSGTFCVWKPKTADGISKCKKSSSTGSTGSNKWKIRYSFKRSNSEGSMENNKKMDISPKQKRNSNKLKAHELFYVQKRAEKEMGRKKSYLPYRKDLVGLFANVNGMAKMLPF